MTLGLLLVAAAGGIVGAPARYLLDQFVTRRAGSGLPWGTLVINVSGSLLLGFLAGLTLAGHLAPAGQALLGTGFCGAYTTYSTFTVETARLLENGRFLGAAGNVLVSVVAGLAAAAAGLAVGLAL